MLNIGYFQFCVSVNLDTQTLSGCKPGAYLTMCTPERAGDKFRKACPVLFNAFPSLTVLSVSS